MTDHVNKKFHNHIGQIQTLIQKDATFKEICADYEEMSTWLDGYCDSVGRATEECHRAMEVLKDLEDEIHRKLKESRGRGLKDSSEQQ